MTRGHLLLSLLLLLLLQQPWPCRMTRYESNPRAALIISLSWAAHRTAGNHRASRLLRWGCERVIGLRVVEGDKGSVRSG